MNKAAQKIKGGSMVSGSLLLAALFLSSEMVTTPRSPTSNVGCPKDRIEYV
jgi:Na+-translocating ferredoxin:NAD+ oxidoreductase RnfD subunit